MAGLPHRNRIARLSLAGSREHKVDLAVARITPAAHQNRVYVIYRFAHLH